MNHRRSPPNRKVVTAFNPNIQDEAVAMTGGIHGAFKAGSLVLKRVEELNCYEWICQNILSTEISGLRLQQPIKTTDGFWSKDCWIAYQYLTGSPVEGRLPQKLEVARKLHHGLKNINNPPPFIIKRVDPWGCAERIVWGEDILPQSIPASIGEQLANLVNLDHIIDSTSQIVHMDLCGNILFKPDLEPAIIDFSPSFRPTLFAEAVLIYDSVVWERGDLNEVYSWTAVGENRKFLRKALAFRLLATVLISEKSRAEGRFFEEFNRAKDLLGATLRN